MPRTIPWYGNCRQPGNVITFGTTVSGSPAETDWEEGSPGRTAIRTVGSTATAASPPFANSSSAVSRASRKSVCSRSQDRLTASSPTAHIPDSIQPPSRCASSNPGQICVLLVHGAKRLWSRAFRITMRQSSGSPFGPGLVVSPATRRTDNLRTSRVRIRHARRHRLQAPNAHLQCRADSHSQRQPPGSD